MKLVILTIDLEEAEAANYFLHTLLVGADFPKRQAAVTFQYKLDKAIKRAKGAKKRV